MNKKLFFIDRDNNYFLFEDDNFIELFDTKDIDYVVIDSNEFDFNFNLLPPINLLSAYQILSNERLNAFWIKLYLNWKNEFLLKKYRRILQKISFNNKLNIPNICPIELIIADWCFNEARDWWLFLFNENGTYRIVAGLGKGVLISRFLEIKSEEDLYEEIYRTFLFIRRYDNVESVEIFTNLQLNPEVLDILEINRIDRESLLKMVLDYAKRNSVFYSINCDKRLYFRKVFNRVCLILNIVLLIFVINNIIDYSNIADNLQKIESNNTRYFLKISKLFNKSDKFVILDFMKKVSDRNCIFEKLKVLEEKCVLGNVKKIFYKEKRFFVEFKTPVSELRIKSNLSGVNYKMPDKVLGDNINFTINKNDPNKGKYKIVELGL